MKKHYLVKRILPMLLVFLMTAACLAGCGAPTYTPPTLPDIPQNTFPRVTLPDLDFGHDTDPTDSEETEPVATESDIKELVGKNGEDISYVMIYNPKVYTNISAQELSTGSLSSQINVDLNRGDGLAEEPEVIPYEILDIDPDLLDAINWDGDKADGLGKIYKVGDKEDFYCGSQQSINQRVSQEFTCVYSGTHANIWTYNSIDQNVLNKLGKAFDDTIYDACVDRFGEARFGETVNFLIYPFSGNPNTVGFFANADLFSISECDAATAQMYGVNRNINVLNINSMFLQDERLVISTLAHEFQHLLCFTGYFTQGNECDVWFNEAMSGYIEEVLYTGIKENHFKNFHDSERIRTGQSLYNFEIDATAFKFDIGVYGSVFLFSEYLENLAGDDVFSKFHKNWRNTYAPLSTAEGIYEAVPASVQNEIDNFITYPSSIRFNSDAEEWLSKLTLSFYLSTFTMDENAAENYKNITLPYLLYDSIMSAQIEGGGRIVLELNDSSFTIPDDADDGLVYIGLNEDLEIVTDIVCK